MKKTKELPELKKRRRMIEKLDRQIVELLIKRRKTAIEIGEIKTKNNLPLCDINLEKTRIRLAVEHAKKITDDEKFHELVGAEIKLAIWHCRDCQFTNQKLKRGKYKDVGT